MNHSILFKVGIDSGFFVKTVRDTRSYLGESS